MQNNVDIGANIRKFRLQKKLTLKQLSEKANITPSMLSQIEHGQASPSLNTIRLLAIALDVAMFQFFMDGALPVGTVVTKDTRRCIVENGITYEMLTPDLRGNIEFCQVIVDPGNATSPAPFHHEGEEVALVLAGTLELQLDSGKVTLQAGDSIRIKAYTNHRWYNPGLVDAVLVYALSLHS